MQTSRLVRWSQFIDRLNDGVGKAVSWLTLLLIIVVGLDVIMRYLFNETQAWVPELEWHLFALIFLLGAGYTLRHDRHVRVDLFYKRFSVRDQALVDLVGTLVLLLPWCLVLLLYAWYYAYESWRIQEGSPDPGGLPARYLIKLAVPLGLLLLFLQGIALAIKAFLRYQNPEP